MDVNISYALSLKSEYLEELNFEIVSAINEKPL